MAKATLKLPEDFLIKLSKLGERSDEICGKVLEAGGRVMAEKVKTCLSSSIGKDLKSKKRSTGELVSSLGISPVMQDRNGNSNVKIGFSEPRSDGGSNAQIAAVLEYGRSGQPAKPFIKPAQSSGRSAAMEAMTAAYDEEVRDI